MNKKLKLLLFILISVWIAIAIIFYNFYYESQEDFYTKAVKYIATESYRGVVKNKFYDKYDHGREKIILNQGISKIEIDFVYENPNLYEFIQLGDTLLKEKNSLNLQIKRRSFDTIIQFKFENIKGSEKYVSPLELLDSLK